jgi:site-specific DNA-methyltransferase (adenine-specific)
MEMVKVHGCTVYNENCISGARQHLSDNSVDLIITDPPYGIAGDTLHRHYNRNEMYVVPGYVEIPGDEYADFSIRWISEAERVLRPGGSIYIMSGYTNLYHILHALKQTSLCEINHLIWKYSFGVFTKHKYVSSHYHILYYEKKGRRRTFNTESRYGLSEKTADGHSPNTRDREDVWVINRQYKPGQQKNKNELPIGLLVKMLQYSSNEGDLVCDLFLGGFSTAKAAIGLNRRLVGFEVSEPLFRAKVRELELLTPGYLLDSVRKPDVRPVKNQGRAWTIDERRALASRYTELKKGKRSKKDIVAALCEEFGRGRFAIEKALQKLQDLPEK